MGTRSLTRVWEKNDEEETMLVNVYRQYDGYPKGLGVELAEFLRDRVVGNGISMNDLKNKKFSNGPGDLAAQLIAYMKAEHAVGGVYMEAPVSDGDWGQEWVYDFVVSWRGGEIQVKVTKVWDSAVVFEGAAEQFVAWMDENGG